MHLSRSHCADDVAAAGELAVVDLVAGRFLHFLGGMGIAPRHHHVLVGDGHFLGLRRSASKPGQGTGDDSRHGDELGQIASIELASIQLASVHGSLPEVLLSMSATNLPRCCVAPHLSIIEI
jgi:hypothetical protein